MGSIDKLGNYASFEPYVLNNDEEYMNDAQLGHFHKLLLAWRHDLMAEVTRTVNHMQSDSSNHPDPNDRATQEEEFSLELRTRDRQRKLVSKIDAALRRIDEDDYGYCDVTGEPISLKRLDARPIATMTIEAQEAHERAEKVHRDD